MTDRFDIKDIPLAGLCLLERKLFQDQREAFARLFCAGGHSEMLGNRQIMLSITPLPKEKEQ
jgi:dTDP-4-dehydrorhamnose 3,5-epimerase-like enzyme